MDRFGEYFRLWPRSDGLLISVGVVVSLTIFSLDIHVSLGVAAGTLYVGTVLICLWAKRLSTIYLMTTVGTALTVLGYFLSPEGGSLWMVIANRALTIFAIWAVALYSVSRLHETARRKAAESDRRTAEISEIRYRHLIDSAEVSIWDEDFSAIYDALEALRDDGVDNLEQYLAENPDLVPELAAKIEINGVNSATLRLFGGASQEDFITSIDKVFGVDSSQVFKEELCAIWRRDDVFRAESSHLTLSGRKLDVVISMPVPKTRDQALSVPVSLFDMTESKKNEAALREGEMRFRRVFQQAPMGIAISGLGGPFTTVNDRFCTMMEYSAKELEGMTFKEITHPDDLQMSMEIQASAHKSNAPYFQLEKRYVTKSGNILWSHLTSCILEDETGQPLYTVAMLEDITERRKAEAALRQSEERFRTVFDTIETGTIVINSEGIIQIFNPAAEEVFGYLSDEVVGGNVSVLMPEPERSDHDSYIRNYTATGEARVIGLGREVIGIRKGGEEFPMQLEVGEMTLGDDTCFVGSIADLTELQSLESQLRQSQKLEAVGQLTGGIAHDFNNLLAVIQGNLSLLEDDINEGRDLNADALWEFIRPALQASERGADLTQRLLAFSRKQALQPRILCLNDLVTGMEDMLRRTLGETIDLKVVLKDTDWQLLIDPSQLENALLNLALNARDAMPEGGQLTIERDDVTLDKKYVAAHPEVNAGEYIMLAVSDTGTGMSPEVLENVFDPFFTTKGVGKGSGLGLSMVHGFVKQSGGHVTIYSEPDEGTTVKIYLPRSLEQEERKPEPETASSGGGDETILVVEDEEEVRRMTVRILKRLGYKLLQAEDGKSALAILEKHGHIDLLLSDVVLPGGMNGPEITKAVYKIDPVVKTLFMSGYTENAIVHHGRVDEDAHLISKPFSSKSLAAKVREILDA